MPKSDAILTQWVSSVDLTNTRIKKFPTYIFLCGGQLAPAGANCFSSCRDVFYSYVKKKNDFISQNIVLAEKVIELFDESGYPDLLTFEKDLAAISLMTIVFSESPGAIAEIGSFSVLENIKDRLLLVMHEEDAKRNNSFIWKGPVTHLKVMAKEKGNDNPIYIYNWSKAFNDAGCCSESVFPDASNLCDAINGLIKKRKKTSLLFSGDVGHVMLLIASSLNVMQIATIEELRLVLDLFNLKEYAKNIGRYLNLLRALDIIGYKQYGNNEFYVSKPNGEEWVKWSYREKNSDFLWNARFIDFYRQNQEIKVKAWRSFQKNN